MHFLCVGHISAFLSFFYQSPIRCVDCESVFRETLNKALSFSSGLMHSTTMRDCLCIYHAVLIFVGHVLSVCMTLFRFLLSMCMCVAVLLTAC